MEIQLRFRRVGEQESWIERYTTEFMDSFCGTPGEYSHDQEGISKWGKDLINFFNEELRTGEVEREFCGARFSPDEGANNE